MDNEKEEVQARNKYYNATITVCANGFIVSIGCQTVVAETPEKLLELVTGYLKNPKEAEKKLFANSIRMDTPQVYTATENLQPADVTAQRSRY